MHPQNLAVITDIEGTTTEIHFVHQVLFPYSRRELRSFLGHHHHTPTVRLALEDALHTITQESSGPLDPNIDREKSEISSHLELLCDHLERWIDEDRKHPALKKIQGFIWEKGYGEKVFLGHLYPDVPKQLFAWKALGIALGVYSSGSVGAQKLLFRHTAYGDLTDLFSWHFDTEVGPKRNPESYRAILKTIASTLRQPNSPLRVIFLTDVLEEALAACQAGLSSIILDRTNTPAKAPSNIALGERGEIPVVCDFYEANKLVSLLMTSS